MGNTNKISSLSPWFHNIVLPDGTQTAPDHYLGNFPYFKWNSFKDIIPEDLNQWSALDIGCNAGFYSLELAKRGAKVTSIDLDQHYLKQGRWIAKQFDLVHPINFQHKQVYDLAKDDKKYDIVWFMGLFYHLRYPLLALDIVAQKVNKMLVFQTLTMPGEPGNKVKEDYNINDRKDMLKSSWPKMSFIEKSLNDDPTNWWAPNAACVEALLRSCGFKIIARPADEIYICEPDPLNAAVSGGWNKSEYLAAIGKPWKKELDGKLYKF